jgi:hypothetical protein
MMHNNRRAELPQFRFGAYFVFIRYFLILKSGKIALSNWIPMQSSVNRPLAGDLSNGQLTGVGLGVAGHALEFEVMLGDVAKK